jgi:hypothetical protein
MWAWFKSKIFISKSLKALEKSAAEKIDSEKNGFFKLTLSKPNQKKVQFLYNFFSYKQ